MQMIFDMLNEDYVAQLKNKDLSKYEELRLCIDQPLLLRSFEKEERLWPKATRRDLELLIASACRQSIYAHTETLKQGFVTIEGGHRIGICGVGVLQSGRVHTINHISSAVIRMARQIIGTADQLVWKVAGSTLLLGPPGSGKTTLLRDLVRQLSDKRNQRVGLIDERGEISAEVMGVAQFRIGMRTDVLVNVPKAEATMMLLRTMRPQWIAMDEITAPADLEAMEQASYCGVCLLATAHASSVEDLENRLLYQQMMKKRIFRTIVLLRSDKTYKVMEV